MPYPEAFQILNLAENATVEEVQQASMRLFEKNDPAKGGSFYLQCKILGAKETLMGSLNVSTNFEKEPESAESTEPKEK